MKKIYIVVEGKKIPIDYETEKECRERVERASLLARSAQIQALTERNEFLEDLIAELAVQVYSTPPSA